MFALTRWILIFLLALLGVDCVSSLPDKQRSARLPQVIFVPGYYGSTLIREPDGKKIWFTAGQALWGDQTLAMDDAGIRVPGAARLRVGEVFRSLGVAGFSKDVYGSVIDGLQAGLSGRANVVAFPYDWRQDITGSSQRLSALVDELYAGGAPKVAVVAHSMGGLVTGHYLLYGDQETENARLDLAGARKLHAVAMAAVPFEGTLAVFRNMQHGIEFGFNAKALEGLAVASFPASYQILPHYANALSSRAGADLSGWIFDAARWREFNWSLLRGADKLDASIRNNRADYTRAMLDLAQTFYKNMHRDALGKTSGLPFLYLLGNSVPTRHRALWDEPERALLFPDKNPSESELSDSGGAPFYLPGDGTVTQPSAQPPKNFAALFSLLQIHTAPQEHLQILKDADNLQALLAFLADALDLPDA